MDLYGLVLLQKPGIWGQAKPFGLRFDHFIWEKHNYNIGFSMKVVHSLENCNSLLLCLYNNNGLHPV